MSTYSLKASEIRRDWYVVDAQHLRLGRLASVVASRLRGKHKPEYTPHLDVGDYIVIVNADKIQVTGNKLTDKVYYRHSGYPGGLKSITLDKMLVKSPTLALEKAIKGMLPKGPLGRQMFRKLNVYAGADHPHAAQQPKQLIESQEDK